MYSSKVAPWPWGVSSRLQVDIAGWEGGHPFPSEQPELGPDLVGHNPAHGGGLELDDLQVPSNPSHCTILWIQKDGFLWVVRGALA